MRSAKRQSKATVKSNTRWAKCTGLETAAYLTMLISLFSGIKKPLRMENFLILLAGSKAKANG